MRKKSGFTLAEAMIAFAVIGVLAALLLPAVNKLRPDEKKMMYIKAYDSLSEAVMRIADNEDLYGETYTYSPDSNTRILVNVKDLGIPLYNINVPAWDIFNDDPRYGGMGKLAYLVAHAMNVNIGDVNLERGESDQCQNENGTDSGPCQYQFTTPNGMQWTFRSQEDNFRKPVDSELKTNDIFYNTIVTLKLGDRVKGNDCMAIENSGVYGIFIQDADDICENDRDAKQFLFIITADGSVTIADNLGLMYQKSRTNFVRNNVGSPSDNKVEVSKIIYDLLMMASEDFQEGSQFSTNLIPASYRKASDASLTGMQDENGITTYEVGKGLFTTLDPPKSTTSGGCPLGNN